MGEQDYLKTINVYALNEMCSWKGKHPDVRQVIGMLTRPRFPFASIEKSENKIN